MTAVVLKLEQVELTDEQFYNLCQVNQSWNLERTATGDLVIMSRRALAQRVAALRADRR